MSNADFRRDFSLVVHAVVGSCTLFSLVGAFVFADEANLGSWLAGTLCIACVFLGVFHASLSAIDPAITGEEKLDPLDSSGFA